MNNANVNNFKGMNPDEARKAMEMIQSYKRDLDRETSQAGTSINERLTTAFAGQQVAAMQGFVDRLNAALQNLYKYLDGADSNFAAKFNEIISSYETSDANVSSTYSASLN